MTEEDEKKAHDLSKPILPNKGETFDLDTPYPGGMAPIGKDGKKYRTMRECLEADKAYADDDAEVATELHSDVMERIQVEVSLGKPGPDEEPDAEAEFRRELTENLGNMNGPGLVVDVPAEFPDVTDWDDIPDGLEIGEYSYNIYGKITHIHGKRVHRGP